MQALFAPNLLIGFGRVEGRPVGVVANQPMQYAGTLDIDASEKAARFVRTCDAFNVPVLTFVDVPGSCPARTRSGNGIIRRGAKLIYATPRRRAAGHDHHRKAYGGAYDVMGFQAPGRGHEPGLADRADRGHGRTGRREHLYRSELADATSPSPASRARAVEYEDHLANPYLAASGATSTP